MTVNGGRRRVLRGLAAAGGAAGVLACTGCSLKASSGERAPVELALAELAAGQRRTVRLGGHAVEVRRTESGVAARSLVCTHMGCTVRWSEPEGRYVCPCHDGRFNAQGHPVAGPPQHPLDEIPVRVEGNRIVVG